MPEYPGMKCVASGIGLLMSYFGIDYEIIWDIATKQLPRNLIDLELILKLEKQKGN
jgi:uncharacterized protein with HEPN domain